jgi:hypothetical protein
MLNTRSVTPHHHLVLQAETSPACPQRALARAMQA